MNNIEESQDLCKSCGLCCSGHLFAWVRLNANELDRAGALGLNVIRDDPRQRGFTQPCPMWNGTCKIYNSLDYPRSCGTYKCKQLRQLLDEEIPLSSAMTVIQQTLARIRELEALLPVSTAISFRERLVAHKEHLEALDVQERNIIDQDFLRKAQELLISYEDLFGVDDFIDFD